MKFKFKLGADLGQQPNPGMGQFSVSEKKGPIHNYPLKNAIYSLG